MYGKLFASMYEGSLGKKGPWEAIVTLQQLVILADQDGTVDMTPDAISRRTTIPLEIVEKGLSALQESDPESRSPNEDGRRIVLLSDSRSWGWRIVNYAYYRAIRSAEERRIYMRQYQRVRRAKESEVNRLSTDVNQVNQSSKQEAGSRKTKQAAAPRKFPQGKVPKRLQQWASGKVEEQKPQILCRGCNKPLGDGPSTDRMHNDCWRNR